LRSSCPRLFEVEAMRDGRLTGLELASFGRHMTTCRACANEAKALDELAGAVRAAGPVDAPADELFVARARTRLLADFDRTLVASGGRGRSRWLFWSSAVVAVVCGLFVAPRRRPVRLVADGVGAVITPGAETIWSKRVEGDAEKIVLAQGALAIHVDHAASRRGRLIVVLPDGELEDIGTTFTVQAGGGQTKQVAVQEGRVLVRIRGNAPIVLNAGEAWNTEAPPASAAGATTPPEPIEPPGDGPQTKRRPQHDSEQGVGLRRAQPRLDADEPPRSKEFLAAVHRLQRGDNCEAAAGFAKYLTRYPDDGRAEDAAYLRVIALQRCGSDDETKAAAREYLVRYPSAFRRAEVERLSH